MQFGLIAGNGKFPFLVIEGARRAGVELAVAAIREETDPAIERVAERVVWVRLGQLGKMIRFFKREGVRQAIMAGQVKHVQIFSGALPDVRMLKMLLRLPRRNTDALIGAVADELASEGIELIDSTYFLQDHLPRTGTLTKREPTERERGDIEYGLEVAREIARLDLGQTIVVRARACVAIEAMEGTDATVRCQQLGVRALLDDPSRVQHDDPVRPRRGGQPVRHDERGPPARQRLARRQHGRLGRRVERGGGLVEQQHVRIDQRGPGQADELALPGRQALAALAHLLPEPVGERRHHR